MTIDEAADCTGIGRNTLRKLVSWGKIPVLRIGRKTIIRIDVISAFMEINQGVRPAGLRPGAASDLT
ncbi:helix-turn-helix domain-containing protein [Pseudoflavonifractor sp. 524-17]|uniref:helix-turn-helix domain-containing protein n=1 Tax=Pseudoflavonifractor sp. 524-17 TaxID=2304577 RepID=UPI001FAC854C|nr:helix-turn-helix domain-containing protein [Pseudoflavonifractor sp. 524-17]